MQHAVITGIGVVSTLGCDLDEVSQSLQQGTSGVVFDPERADLGFACPLTGHLRGWAGREKQLSRKVRKSMHEPALYGAVAALDAVADSGLEPEALKAWTTGLIIGNDSTVVPSAEAVNKTLEKGYTASLGTGAVFQVLNSTVSMNLATLLGVRGANWTVAAACASSAHAIGQAAMLIESGQQDIVIAGGTQELGWQSMAAFDALQALSTRADEPDSASRPFDQQRDGLVPSGGAAVVVLERRESAKARAAHIYAEILSYAFSSNGAHISKPTVEGPVWCMNRALEQAQLDPDQIDYINAHATGTVAGDLLEGRALLQIFGADGPPTSSTKSMTGHECWMSGASQIAYGALMMRDGFLAPNRNLDQLDVELTGLNVISSTERREPRTILANSFGFGGTNSALIMRKG